METYRDWNVSLLCRTSSHNEGLAMNECESRPRRPEDLIYGTVNQCNGELFKLECQAGVCDSDWGDQKPLIGQRQ